MTEKIVEESVEEKREDEVMNSGGCCRDIDKRQRQKEMKSSCNGREQAM